MKKVVNTVSLILFSTLLLFMLFNIDKNKNITANVYGVFSKFISSDEVDSSFNSLVKYIKEKPGTYSVYVKDFNTLKSYEYNTDENYYVASLFKLPIGIAVIKQIELGNLSLDTKFTYWSYHYADGTGIINRSDYGTEYTVDELLKALYKHSDNVAQSMLLEQLGVTSSEIRDAFPSNGDTNYYHINESNTKEIGKYLEYIHNSDYLTPDSKRYLLDLMTGTSFDSWLADNLNSSFAHKIGSWYDPVSWHDCGILYKDKVIVVCVMSKDTDFTTYLDVNSHIAEFVNLLN